MSSYRITGRLPAARQRPAEHPLPPARTMARNAAGAVVQTVRQLAAGRPLSVSREAAERRQEVCRACKEWYRPTDQRCAHPQCGCFLRLKTWLLAQRCPAGRW